MKTGQTRQCLAWNCICTTKFLSFYIECIKNRIKIVNKWFLSGRFRWVFWLKCGACKGSKTKTKLKSCCYFTENYERLWLTHGIEVGESKIEGVLSFILFWEQRLEFFGNGKTKFINAWKFTNTRWRWQQFEEKSVFLGKSFWKKKIW